VEILSNLKLIRKSKRLSQAELAQLVGVRQQYISDLETGRFEGSLSKLRRVAKALNVKISDLINEEAKTNDM
jgi:transcriptional regulator with XRE-family HTH domain